MPKPENPADNQPVSQLDLADQVQRQTRRKLRARAKGRASPLFGLGMFGLVGWSVALPTLLGAAIGAWIDDHSEQGISWTLALLMAGLCLGCFNAWMWVRRERPDDD